MGYAAFPTPDAASTAPQPSGDSLLAAITAGLSAGDDLRELLQRFLEPVVRIAQAQGGGLRLIDEASSELRWVCGVQLPPGACVLREGVDRHCGACGRAADQREAVWVDDLLHCSNLRQHETPTAESDRHMLVVPLQHRGEVLGVYTLFFDAARRSPPPDVMAMLRSVGELLGLALKHAQLEEAHLQATVLRERQAMAAEVHDSLGQSLMFVKMRLPLLEDALHAGDTPRALRYCGELRETASQSHASLRALLTQLRAPMDPQGLLPALARIAEQFRRHSGTVLDVVNDWPDLSLAPEREADVFHIVQEALANIARHAGAGHAWLHIGRDADGALQLSVEDDGAGLRTTTPAGRAGDRADSVAGAGAGDGTHYGLAIMHERALRLGGRLEIGERAGGGTRVALHVPTDRRPVA